MQAMVLETARAPLRMRELPTPVPAAREILLEVAACGVCRTDLDGELPNPKLPLIEGESLKALGLYGFGAAAHILAQVAAWQGRRVYAFTRGGDTAAQAFARSLGAVWAGSSDEMPPEPLDAAIIFAPVGALVPLALKAVKKGGRVVCGGIHMSDIPRFPYSLLWEERHVVSVANLTRADAREFLDIVPRAGVKTEVTRYPLDAANDALSDLREGRLQGAAVLTP
jgi:alcohol dehydrogenase, propanol-preferring